MSDYAAYWPVWGLDDDEEAALSPELKSDLIAWQEVFEDGYHWERGWHSGAAEADYVRAAPDLRDRLAYELGDGIRVVLDTWPVTNDSLVAWLRQDDHPWA